MKGLWISSVILLTFACATHDKVSPFPDFYPCTLENPCTQHSTFTVKAILQGQVDSCGGRYEVLERVEEINLLLVKTKCTGCKNERTFFFLPTIDPKPADKILSAFRFCLDLYDESRLAEAIPWLEDTIYYEPGFIEARLLLARCYISQSRFDDARKQLEVLETLTRTLPDLYLIHAELAIAEGRVDDYTQNIKKFDKLNKLMR